MMINKQVIMMFNLIFKLITNLIAQIRRNYRATTLLSIGKSSRCFIVFFPVKTFECFRESYKKIEASLEKLEMRVLIEMLIAMIKLKQLNNLDIELITYGPLGSYLPAIN